MTKVKWDDGRKIGDLEYIEMRRGRATKVYKVDIKCKGNEYVIYINDLIHVAFKCTEYIGLQSTIESTHWYCIKFYLINRIIKCEYEKRELWEEILRQLDKIKL